jgi:adenosylcobyric acid synthase
MAKSIMVQGTASSVGKSIITAGICRLLKREGHLVAPFKSQNMALNSYITAKGHEMGRAQVVQAEAAGIEPDVLMNPILLKPSTDQKAQVILNGKVYKNMSAVEYHAFKPELRVMVKETYDALAKQVDYIVIEGAGSPAEINLREGDLVNMGMAELSNSPVVLVGDIDRGGVFASLYGTVMLLEPHERDRIVGMIINKFRGDVSLLKSGLDMIEEKLGIPVLGVVPYTDLKIEDEDSLSERFRIKQNIKNDVHIEVLYLPHVSNFTDFHVFDTMEDVSVRYVMRTEAISEPDLLIIPGSKNTIEDMLYLHQTGLSEQILRLARKGVTIVGICGGYQMLGQTISDPHGTESSVESVNGLGLLATTTTFEPQKTTTQIKGEILKFDGCLEALSGCKVFGYEIHMGQTTRLEGAAPFVKITESLGKPCEHLDGAMNEMQTVFGTYIHGLFDDTTFVRQFINTLRQKKGLEKIVPGALQKDFAAFKDEQYSKLADLLETSIDWVRLKKLIEDWHR